MQSLRSAWLISIQGRIAAGLLILTADLAIAALGEAPGAAPRLGADIPEGSPGSGHISVGGEPRELRVCPAGQSRPECRYHGLEDALAAARPGDRVVLAPGVHQEGAAIGTPGLVLRGEPGAHLRGHAIEGKAALVVKADGVVIEGIECSGIAVPDGNGACIRIEGDDLTVRNVHFHDNQEGILSGPGGGMLVVEASLLERNGFGGLAHGIYVGRNVETFVFRANRVLATTGTGHGVKSRAQRTIIEHNVIAGLDGQDSRAIDVPNGGEVVIRGNVLEKGPNSANAEMIGLALEGDLHDTSETLIENNLLVFDTLPQGLIQDLAQAVGLLPARGIVVRSESPGRTILRGNTIVGARDVGGDVIERDNPMYRSRRDADLPPYPAIPEPMR
jgi:Right handed beta helix region